MGCLWLLRERKQNTFSNKKEQSPSYTDRVLWHSLDEQACQITRYAVRSHAILYTITQTIIHNNHTNPCHTHARPMISEALLSFLPRTLYPLPFNPPPIPNPLYLNYSQPMHRNACESRKSLQVHNSLHPPTSNPFFLYLLLPRQRPTVSGATTAQCGPLSLCSPACSITVVQAIRPSNSTP